MAFRAFALFWAYANLNSEDLAHFYWISSNIVACLRLLVVWEVLRWVTRQRPALARGLRLASLFYFCAMAALCLGMKTEGAYYIDIERKLSLVTMVWAALVLLSVVTLSIRLTRPVWSIVIGLGIYVAVYLMNQVSFDLFRKFTLWSLVRQSDFSILIAIWLWGFWKKDAPESHSQNRDAELLEWKKSWNRTQSQVDNLRHPG